MRKRLDTMYARKLASVDFHWGMDPVKAATISQIDPKTAERLRTLPEYQSRLDELQLELDAVMRTGMQKESEKLRMRFAELVPEAVEKLAQQVQRDDVLGLQAAKEILDRDGRMPKVSRVQQTIEDKTGIPDVDDKVLDEFKVAPKVN